jgi:NAD(P)H-hydrate epimerase
VLPVFTAEEMRRLDRRAIDDLGLPGPVLMENAGRGAAAAIAAFARRERLRGDVVIVCGKGGNGGDGFVVARELRRRRWRARVLLLAPPAEVRSDAALKLRALRRAGVRPIVITDERALDAGLAGATLIVDAILGTGARGAPSGLVAHAIESMNASGRPIVALDAPSGLDSDHGIPLGPCVRAALTTTFAALKRGLVLEPGAGFAGRVEVVDIAIPPAEVARATATFLLERADIAPWFPPRKQDVHKGTYGHLLVVGGSLGKTGAAALAGSAAMRSGAGLVTVATAASQQPVVAGLTLEGMTEALPETAAHTVSAKAREPIGDLAAARDAVALGPGLGLDAETQALARELVRDLERPLAVDADALTSLAGHLDVLTSARGPRCLTPHPGEMARMLGVSIADVQRDRIECARRFAVEHRVHVVLKGARSVIADPEGRVYLNPTGNPGMASGGTGDVLTGILGAFLARRLPPGAAMQCAVYLHGLAGDVAAARVGHESLIASDVVAALPDAFARLRASEHDDRA